MSTHVLLNLLKELRKIYKMRGLSSILSFFRKEFNKFKNTGAKIYFFNYAHAFQCNVQTSS